MARDYSHRRNNSGGKNRGKQGKTRPATRRKSARKNRRRTPAGTPGWVWLASGLCLGLTVAAAAYILTRPIDLSRHDASQSIALDPSQPAPSVPEADATEETADTAEPESGQDTEETWFSFYDMLPQYRVEVDAGTAASGPAEQAGATTNTDNNAADQGNDSAEQTPSEQTPTTPQTTSSPATPSTSASGSDTYIIQAGSFSRPQDAQRHKAKLALLGLSTNVVRFELDSGQVVYRVQSETIDSEDRMTELLKRLHDNDFKAIVLRRGG